MASSNPLAGAKSALEHAKSLTKSVEGSNPSAPQPVQNQYSGAPYSLVGKIKKALSAGKGDSDTAAGINAVQKNLKQYQDATKQ